MSLTGESGRTLPIRAAIGPGESLQGWLERVAISNKMPATWLLDCLGLSDLVARRRELALIFDIPQARLHQVEVLTGTTPGRLATAVLDQYRDLSWPWPLASGSRYCTHCLRRDNGTWQLRWTMPYTFACAQHRVVLAGVCPSCLHIPRRRWSQQIGLRPLSTCATQIRNLYVCQADLLTHEHQVLAADDPRLLAQKWIDELLGNLPRQEAKALLDDMHLLTQWCRSRLQGSNFAHLGPDAVLAVDTYRQCLGRGRSDRLRRRQSEPAAIAALATYAIDMLTGSDPVVHHHLALVTRPENPRTASTRRRRPLALADRLLRTVSTTTQQRLLHSFDSYLAPEDRLRHRTCTLFPVMPQKAGHDRARHVPQYLWTDWIVRFQPVQRHHGTHTATLATHLAAALLMPGAPDNRRANGSRVRLWSNTNRTLARLAQQWPDMLPAICTLASYLDSNGAPIDYQRRRDTFTDGQLNHAQWVSLCQTAGANPGKQQRYLHANRYLFQLLTGADLNDRQHRLAFTDWRDSTGYVSLFTDNLTTALRIQLHAHAAHVLAAHHIDEPVTWSPPASCRAGYELAGREPDDIDIDTVRQLAVHDRIPVEAVAQRMRRSISHIRLALQDVTRDGEASGRYLLAVSGIEDRAAQILTPQFLTDQHLNAGKDIRTLEAETGINRQLIIRHAAQAGIGLRGLSHNQPIPIDPVWLREQVEVLQRSCQDIADDLGLAAETIRRNIQRWQITPLAKSAGNHARHRFPHLPADLRRAVECHPRSWLRLKRFAAMQGHPSIAQAATHIGVAPSVLVTGIARLETHIGAPLITRWRYGQPMQFTDRGLALLKILAAAEVTALINRYAK